MGLFSGKKVTTIGVSALDLGVSGYNAYYAFRKNLLFAVEPSINPIERFQEEMFKYKQSVKHAYSSARLSQYGIDPIETTTTISKTPTVVNFFKDNPSYYNLKYPDFIIPRSIDWQTTVATDPFDPNEAPAVQRGIDGRDTWIPVHIDSLNEDGYAQHELSDAYDPDSGVSTPENFYLVYDSQSYDDTTRVFTTSFRLYQRPQDSNDVNLIETHTDDTYDLTDYVFKGISVFTTGFNQGEVILRMGVDIDTSTQSFSVTQQYEPLISLKEANKATLADYGGGNLTDEEKLKAFYQNKILESIGMNFDSAKPYLDNDKITDLKVGMIFNLNTINENRGVIHSFFNNLEIFSNQEDSSYIGSDHIYEPTYYPIHELTTIKLPLSDMTLEVSFQLERFTRDSISLAINEKLRCKLKLISNDTMDNINSPEMVSVYEDLYGAGSSDGLTVFEMRNDVIADYNSSSDPSDALKEAYGLLPTIKQLSALYDIIDTVLYIPEFTNTTDIEDFLVSLDPDTYTGYSVTSYRYISASTNSNFKYEVIEQSVTTLSHYTDFNNVDNCAKYIIRRTDDSTDSEVIYVLCGLKMRYYDSSGHDYTSYGQIGSTTPFFMPVRYGALDNIPFFDYIESKDAMLNGIVFTVQVVKLKWYQTGIFRVVLQIVLVVIAVAIEIATSGTATSIATVLLSTAESLAVAFAISTVVTEVAKAFNIDSSIVQIALAVVEAYFTSDTTNLFESLGLLIADQALKYQTIQYQQDTERLIAQQKEIDRKLKLIQLTAQSSDKKIKPWAILENIINSQDATSTSDSSINLSMQKLEEAMERSKYSVEPEVRGVTYDLQSSAFSTLNHAERQYSIEYQIGIVNNSFGDNTNL